MIRFGCRRSVHGCAFALAVGVTASCGGESAPNSAANAAPAPEAGAEPAALAAIRGSFERRMPEVLTAFGSISAAPEAFAVIPRAQAGAPRSLDVRLPRHGAEPIVMRAASGLSVAVREAGADADGEASADSVVYAHRTRSSVWTAAPGGVEEWLHVPAGDAHAGRVLAHWDVDGGTLREVGSVIEIVDGAGVPRIRVSAPAAYAAGDRRVEAKLHAHDRAIELSVDADGAEVLVDPKWVSTDVMSYAERDSAASAPLVGGKVLIAGGGYAATAEVYDPTTNTWASTGNMVMGRSYVRGNTLTNGKVLVTGGLTFNGTAGSKSTEIYDPATNTWTGGPTMNAPHWAHVTANLENGKVLVVSGTGTTSAELYDPATNTFSNAAATTERHYATATVLANGKVLVAGGSGTGGPLASAELYDPATDTWSPAGTMSVAREYLDAALLPNGKVLVAGGDPTLGTALADVDLYDPATNSWSTMPSLATARYSLTLTWVPALGRAAAVGGFITSNNGQATTTVELFDPGTKTWSTGPAMPYAHAAHTATLLGSGNVLVAGDGAGYSGGTGAIVLSVGAQGGACSADSDCLSNHCVDGVCCDTACNAGACDACAVAGGATADGTCTLLTGNACDDGNGCTQTDTCQSGACVGANPVTCTAQDQCHDAGTCDAATGQCSNPAKADGASCNDNNACTQTDTCQTGACVGGNAITCTAQDQCHEVGTCDPATGTCSNPAKADGDACDDGDACTQSDTCQAGACSGANPVTCTAFDECHDVGTCDGATGQCSSPAKADGTACSGGVCTAGACTAVDAGADAADDGAAEAGDDAAVEASADAGTEAGDDGAAEAAADAANDVVADAHNDAQVDAQVDAKPDTGAGGGNPDAATADAAGDGASSASEGSDDGGCGCRTAPTRSDANAAMGALLLGFVAVGRRRRSARARQGR